MLKIQIIKCLIYLIFNVTFTKSDIWQKESGMPQAMHNNTILVEKFWK
jgi:hypothetical protein